jgi:hypothetical protein
VFSLICGLLLSCDPVVRIGMSDEGRTRVFWEGVVAREVMEGGADGGGLAWDGFCVGWQGVGWKQKMAFRGSVSVVVIVVGERGL